MAMHGWPAQKAHTACQVAGRPRGHVGARVERHVWLAMERERKILRGEFVPLFNRAVFFYFLRVGVCSHTVFPFSGRVAVRGASDSGSTAVIAWTRVHAITIKARA